MMPVLPGVLTFDERVSPGTTAIIVVDVQNDFCSPDGPLAQAGYGNAASDPTAEMMAPLGALIDAAREVGTTVVFIQNVANDHTVSAVAEDLRLRTRPDAGLLCRPDTWGAELYGFEPRDDEPIVVKHRYSAFLDTDLPLILRNRGIRTVIITGVATNVCVESTARDAYARDYFVVVPSDTTACYDPAKKDATLTNVADHLGVVTTAADVIASWRAPG